MTTAELITELSRRGVALFLDGERLRFRAPAGALDEGLREAITDLRPAIIAALRPAPAVTAKHAPPCGTCDRDDWRDDPTGDGRIRTTCGKCGRFIGYRPVGG